MAGKSKKDDLHQSKDSDESSDDSNNMSFDESEGEEDAEDVDVDEQQVASKKRKLEEDKTTTKTSKKQKMNVKPPTAEELIHLRETENLFQSNLFRLQIEEMIKEVRPRKSERNSLRNWLNQLTAELTGTDVRYEKPLSDVSWLKELGITFPIPLTKNYKKKVIFKFLKPVKVLTVGSFVNGTLLGPSFSIDLAIVMPKKCFEKEDHLDMRYLIKRAMYLCVISSIISKSVSLSDEKVKFWTKTGDPLKPVLVCKAPGKGSVEILLTAIPEEGTFKTSKFVLDKNNIRPDVSDHLAPSQLPDTPYYNSQLLEDVVLEENEKLKISSLQNNQNARDAIVLLGVWLKQRGMTQGYGAVNMHLISMLMVHLLQNQVINYNMSSYQIIRHVWLFISQGDWTEKGPSLMKGSSSEVPNHFKFHSIFPVVFIDSTGYFNFTFRMNKLTYLKFRSESQLAVKYLNDSQINSFKTLFMNKMNFIEQYDHILSFTNPDVINKTVFKKTSGARQLDYSCHTLPLFLDLLTNLFLKGLKDRVKTVGINLLSTPKWGMTEKSPAFLIKDVLMLGFQLNSETSLAIIERGPDASTPESKEFRAFWGNKCELRRFRDSEVCEAVVWGKTGDPLRERRLILQKIITYLLEEKLGITAENFTYIADQLSPIIQNKSMPTSTNEESSQAVHKVYESLAQQLRELTGLPLNITSVHCISPVFRFTDIFPPLPAKVVFVKKHVLQPDINVLLSDSCEKCPSYVAPIEVVIQMALTQKWPNNVNAGKRLIAAFYIAIAAELRKRYDLDCQITTDFVQVLKEGFVFRLYLGYGKEIALLKEKITSQGVKQYRDTKESIMLEKKFINLPKLTGALYGLSQVNSGFGGAACLAKRWIASQLLDDDHFPEIVIELLVAYLFTSPQPFSAAVQPLPAFLRFLNLLATTNWNIEPIIINFNNLLDREKCIEIEQLFNTQRETLPPLFIATPYDKTGCLWTRDAPTLPTLVRLAKLASTTYKILEIRLSSFQPSKKLRSVFFPPMNAYNVIINLNTKMLSRIQQSISWEASKKAIINKIVVNKTPITDFNPAQLYLSDLRNNYGDFALFFYDIYGGKEIGVIFKPQFLKTVEFKTSHIAGRKPIETEGKILLVPDKEALIEGFKILGSGIVNSVTVHS
ncbi:nucleolar protein 6 [Cimex lectularius]|uniref:Nucleolar protein 6 n=1 Tax=Cimex lectularius TaxID=79782 RepID=A0A8I6RRN5_CIMLE|nr:nucleolar protein 6 [Cimex lectularius]